MTASPDSLVAPSAQKVWTGGWAVPMQRPSIGFEPNWSEEGFSDHSLRQVVRVTVDGNALRLRLSNRYGAAPLMVRGTSVGLQADGAGVRADSTRSVTFGSTRSVTVPPGAEVLSDPVALPVARFDSVVVTTYLPETTGPATTHLQAYATSYRAIGDRLDDTAGTDFVDTTHSWYYLSGVEVLGSHAASVVAFGDSITDGYGSVNDADNRYPDLLAERLAAAGTPRPVLNAGIGGNMLLSDSAWFGERAVDRFDRDVLALPGVGSVILFGGLNDLGFSEIDLPTYKPNPQRSVEELTDAVESLAGRAHARGISVVAATLLPMKGAEYYTRRSAEKIRRFNDWVRTSNAADSVADFHRAVADPRDPEQLDPRFDSGDHKHPNPAGYRRMADAIDLSTL